MADAATLETLVSLFQDQRSVTHSLWALYAVTTFTAAAFSFRNHARFPLSVFVAIGYMAFALGHLSLVLQSMRSANALAEAINQIAGEDPFSAASRTIANTANAPWQSKVAHLTIDACACILIIFGKGQDTEEA